MENGNEIGWIWPKHEKVRWCPFFSGRSGPCTFQPLILRPFVTCTPCIFPFACIARFVAPLVIEKSRLGLLLVRKKLLTVSKKLLTVRKSGLPLRICRGDIVYSYVSNCFWASAIFFWPSANFFWPSAIFQWPSANFSDRQQFLTHRHPHDNRAGLCFTLRHYDSESKPFSPPGYSVFSP